LVKKVFTKIISAPNVLTFARILLIIPFSFFMMKESYSYAVFVLIISAATDFFDGFLARINRQQSKFGAILDPVADKLTLLSVMICIALKFSYVIPFMIILISKEICMLLAGAMLLKTGREPLKARWYGKLGTAFFYFSVAVIVFFKAAWNIENQFLTSFLMTLTALLMAYSLVRYFSSFLKIILNDKKK
jgi:cardiolipin synthase